jgi:hypothetical protein
MRNAKQMDRIGIADSCPLRQSGRNAMDDFGLLKGLASALVIEAIVIALAVLIWMAVASANAECLTYKEARANWPHEHLTWYSPRHCWTNNSNHRRHRDESDSHIVVIREIEFSILDAQAGSQATWPRSFAPWTERIGGAFKQ